MNILRFTDEFKEILLQMMKSYFSDDLHVDWNDKTIDRIGGFVISQYEKGIISILLAFKETVPIGFAVYQVDREDSDWCKRVGWGFIREFYIQKDHRRSGMGGILASEIEQQLRGKNIKQIYLTTDTAVEFWHHCGYQTDSSTVSEDMLTLSKELE